MTRVAIIGTGALGARHLQAHARLTGPLFVDLVDPIPAAREKALALLSEIGGLKGEVRQFGCIRELPISPDIAVVATNARDRLPAIQELCSLGCPALILEKVLFTRPEEYALAEEAIQKAGVKAWVNCVRRTAPRFRRLEELIAGRPVSYKVEGLEWGLACNVIHHLDEWMYLSRAQMPILVGSFDPEMILSSRNGYFELFGTLRGVAGSNGFTAISSRGRNTAPAGDRTITICCEDSEFIIGQTSQELVIRKGAQIVSRESYPVAMQSEATAWHVATILAGGEPSLPRYEESAKLHLALLDVLLPHFQSLDPSLSECPIT